MKIHSRFFRSPAVASLLTAVSGLAAVSFLAACGGRDGDRQTVESRHATPAPVTSQQSATGAPQPDDGEMLPVGLKTASNVEPATPPTPEETKTAWREGVALYESGDFEDAMVRLQIAASGRPDDPYVQYLFGLALWKAGHLEESEKALLGSAALNDGSERTFLNLARVRLDRKDHRGALEAADRALALRPGSAQALHQRGRALDGLNRGDEARDTLQQARMSDPANGYIANTLGYLLLRQGRTDEAVVELEAARQSLPGVAYVRNNLGVAYERRGEIDKAVAEFQAAVEAGDSNGKAALSLVRLEPVRERLLTRREGTPDPHASEVARADDGSGEKPPNR